MPRPAVLPRGRIAAILWALYPAAVAATSLYCSEVLFTLLLLLSAFLLSRSGSPRRGTMLAALAGLAAAADVLVRPPLPVLFAAAAAGLLPSQKGAKRLLVFALFLVIGILPRTARNWMRFHSFIPVCANEGAVLGRHSVYLVPEDVKNSAAWKERYARFCALDGEAARSAGGYRFGLYNAGTMFSGGSAMPRDASGTRPGWYSGPITTCSSGHCGTRGERYRIDCRLSRCRWAPSCSVNC